MAADPFGECFARKKSVRMLAKTRNCPLIFNAWVVYSFLMWKRRYEEDVSATDIADFTGLDRTSAVKRALNQLQSLGLATQHGRLWRGLSQPIEPVPSTGETDLHKMGEWRLFTPPQPYRPWFASKKKNPKFKHAPSWALYLPTTEAPLTLIQCGLLFLLNSYRAGIYPTILVRRRSHAQLARMLGVHQETIPKALKALETHGFMKTRPDYYELLPPDADKLAWFRDATRPGFMEPGEWEKPALGTDDPKFVLMQELASGGIPPSMAVDLVRFCEQQGISLEKLHRCYQEVRVIHSQNQLEGRFTEIRHCGCLLKERLERLVKKKG